MQPTMDSVDIGSESVSCKAKVKTQLNDIVNLAG